MTSTRRAQSTDVRIRAVRPNAGLRKAYAGKLRSLVRQMAQDVAKELEGLYRKVEPRIAKDAKSESPAERLQKIIDRTRKKWEESTRDFAEDTADWFVRKTRDHVDRAQNSALRASGFEGFDLRFDKGQISQDAFDALVNANTSLIKSISSRYLQEVEGLVMRAVTDGRDVAGLKSELSKRYGITQRRADFIARDQCNKATEALCRANDLEVGVEQGEWIHVPGKHTSRETHKEMDGKKFDLKKGLYDRDVGRYVLPGELPGCFVGESKLNDLPFPMKLYRRLYTGKLAEFITDDGTVCSATPNHPVLTLKGWKPARLLDKGDYLIHKKRTDCSLIRELNANRVVPTFKELFDSLVLGGVPASVSEGSAGQFHGDGADGEVDVIDVYGLLTNEVNAELSHVCGKVGLSFAEAADFARLLSGLRPSDAFIVRVSNSGDGKISGLCDRFSSFFRSLSKTQKLCLLNPAHFDPSSFEPSPDGMTGNVEMLGNSLLGLSALVHGDDFILGQLDAIARAAVNGDFYSSLPKVLADDVGGKPDLFCDLNEALAFGYGLSRVSEVRFREFFGHVYNMETSVNWYIVNNTVVHNCQCTYRPILSRKLWKKNS